MHQSLHSVKVLTDGADQLQHIRNCKVVRAFVMNPNVTVNLS